MSRLYTTLVMVKMALNDGRLPPMTPIPEKIRHIINPDFVPGLGALNEDAEKGLQCPVCGVWYHALSNHLNAIHAVDGGAEGVRRVMGIPKSASLLSTPVRERMRAASLAAGCGSRTTKGMRVGGRKVKRKNEGRKRVTVGERNLRNTCDAQTGHRLWDLRDKVGRSPTVEEAHAMDPNLVTACKSAFGGWNAAKAYHGIDTYPNEKTRYNRESVLECVSAWVEEHGRLPFSDDTRNSIPILPLHSTIIRHLEADSWPAAMRKAAILLGIHDARYRPAP